MAEADVSNLMSNLSLDNNYTMVAAIDFGTTFSGYAYAFKKNPKEIEMNHNWGEALGFSSYKTPTTVLLDKDNKFVAFGYDAEQQYGEMEEDEKDNYNLHRQFKMMLYKEEHVKRKAETTSQIGTAVTAMDLFSMAIKYLKDHLIDAASRQLKKPIGNDLIRWVLTVPAIWSISAKQFMREAAFKAGLMDTVDSKQLLLALEPEAASIYCRSLEINHFIGGSDQAMQTTFANGTRYIVIDAGGGTVDITAHEIIDQQHGLVKELYRATGGPWGGKQVDENFISVLKDVLGEDFIKEYQNSCPQDWLHFIGTFETAKRSTKMNTRPTIRVPMPYSMAIEHQKIKNKSIDDVMKKDDKPGIKLNKGTFILEKEMVFQLFNPLLQDIVCHISSLLKEPKLKYMQYILLVGGFCESDALQQAIRSEYEESGIVVLIPRSAQLAIIKGAVQFGFQPMAIRSRIARKTYGMDINAKFDPTKHEKKRKIFNTNYEEDVCPGICNVLVTKDNVVDVGSIYCHNIFAPGNQKVKFITFPIYSTIEKWTNEPVHYIDDPSCQKEGKMKVKNLHNEYHGFKIEIMFGFTEIEISATDEVTNERGEITLDFLAD